MWVLRSPATAKPPMREVAFSLGGNIGDREGFLRAALDALRATEGLEINAVSRLYATAPWGKEDQNGFLNACALGRTTLSPKTLLAAVQAIENRLGRVREERWGPRVIDIDIIALGEEVSNDPALTLPHPRAAERAFVLVPLAEIAPDLKLGKDTVADILARLPRVEGDVVPYP